MAPSRLPRILGMISIALLIVPLLVAVAVIFDYRGNLFWGYLPFFPVLYSGLILSFVGTITSAKGVRRLSMISLCVWIAVTLLTFFLLRNLD